MADESRLSELTVRWRAERRSGRIVTAEELCADCPDLRADLEDRLRALESLEAVPGSSENLETTQKVGCAPPDAADPALLPAVPGYEVLGELGCGAMGVVYKARQINLNRVVALKMILAGARSGPVARARFRAEAEAVALLQHPNIVQVHQVGECPGGAGPTCPFLVLEYCSGGSLAALLKVAPPPPRRAAALAETLARAVQYAHDRGVVHRDLKPGNILLTADGAPKVADFGLAKRLDADGGPTRSSTVLGTPAYMPPEQAAGDAKHVGPAADVYALGAILYELLAGRPPFKGISWLSTIELVRSEEPIPPRRLRPGVPRDLETICLKCLRKEPRSRYASAAALAEDLRRFQAGEPIAARPVGRAERVWRWCRRRPTAAALAALAAAAVLTVLGVAFWYTAKLGEANGRAEAARTEADAARALAASREYYARLNRVREQGARPAPGWTWAALDELAAAARLDTPARRPTELRAEAAACLAAVDLREAGGVADDCTPHRLAYGPDGRVLALGRQKAFAFLGCTVRLVDPVGCGADRLLCFAPSYQWQTAHGAQDGVKSVAFSPDGRFLVVGARSGRLHRWDLTREGPAAFSWAGHEDEAGALAFSPDGRYLYSRSEKDVKRWDVAAPDRPPAQFARAGIDGLAVYPVTGEVVCTAAGQVHFLNPADLTPTRDPVGRSGHVFGFSPDGRTVVLADGRSLLLLECATGQVVRTFRGPDEEAAHDGRIDDAAFSPDGGLLASSSEETHDVRVWETAGGRLVAALPFGGGPVRVAFRPDGRTLAVLADDRTHLYEISAPAVQTATAWQPHPVRAVALSPDAHTLACLAECGVVDQGDLTTWPAAGPTPGSAPRSAASWRVRFHGGCQRPGVAFHPDGGLACTGWTDVPLRGFGDAADALPEANVYALQFDPDGRLWTAAGSEVRAWELPACREAAHWSNALAGPLSGLGGVWAVAPGRGRVVVGGRDGAARLLDAADGAGRAVWPLSPAPIHCAALNADETLAAFGTSRGEVHVLRLPGGEVAAALHAHQDAVEAVAFARGLLATGSRDRTVRLWKCADGELEELITLRMPGPVAGLALAADGATLAVLVHNERAVRVWRLDRLRRALADLGLDW
jgi:WD40 repeat protein